MTFHRRMRVHPIEGRGGFQEYPSIAEVQPVLDRPDRFKGGASLAEGKLSGLAAGLKACKTPVTCPERPLLSDEIELLSRGRAGP